MAQEDHLVTNGAEASPIASKADQGVASGAASKPSEGPSEKKPIHQNDLEGSPEPAKANAGSELPTGILIEKDDYLSSRGRKAFAEYTLVARQIFNDKDKREKTTVEINSPQILSALKETVKYYPSEPLQFEQQTTFDSPFMLLNHYKQELQQYAEKSTDKATKSHIDLLLRFLKTEAGDKDPESQRLKQAGLMSFDLLWLIFKPGDLLYSSTYGHDRLYRLQKAGYQDSCSSQGKFFELSCAYTSCDGTRAGTSSVNLRIWEKKEFVGSSPSKITGLSIFPLKHLEEKEGLEDRLTARDKRYLQIRGVETFDYDGLFLYLKTPPYDFYDEQSNYDGTWLPRSATGRVIVDAKTFIEEMRDQKEELVSLGAASKDTSGREHAAFDDLEANPLLCPPHVYGFSLETKEWCKYFVEFLRPIDWKKDAMETLIISDAQRRLIRSLVTSHRFPDQARDETTLKGKGLIVLLHGSPGSGKTLTAELVAEHTMRPLLKISTGELGSWMERISHELKKLLTYASIWRAIVLIDEADVFLEARKSGPEQFEQNNFVAVFLRQLEYFQGILFLTSNRVEVFDDAIRSRIHLALQYHAPGMARRRLLWRQHLAALPKKELGLDVEACLDRLEKPEMNGREISNAVNTARTLAAGEGGKLKPEHLETVLEVWEDFQSALSKIMKK